MGKGREWSMQAVIRFVLRGLVVYVLAWIAGLVLISLPGSPLNLGNGPISVAWAAAGVLPYALPAGLAVLLVILASLSRIQTAHPRLTAVAISWVCHLGLLLVISAPWEASFEPSMDAFVTGLGAVWLPATALGLFVWLPPANTPDALLGC